MWLGFCRVFIGCTLFFTCASALAFGCKHNCAGPVNENVRWVQVSDERGGEKDVPRVERVFGLGERHCGAAVVRFAVG